MNPATETTYIAFESDRRIAFGDLREIARVVKDAHDRRPDASILVFDGRSSGPVELDLRGSMDDVLARLPAPGTEPAMLREAGANNSPNRGPGRPKLGVVAREITLLPRHWEWLAQQSGGASVAIRKLVDEARRNGDDRHRIREGQEAAYRFMSVLAGNKPHYEEAIRALFAPDPIRFEKLIAEWPVDVRDHALRLAERTFQRETQPHAG